MMDGNYMSGQWGGMVFGPFLMILFFGLIIAIAVVLVKWLTDRGPTPSGNSSLDILKERYASGEIDKAEFEEMRKTLRH